MTATRIRELNGKRSTQTPGETALMTVMDEAHLLLAWQTLAFEATKRIDP